MNEPANPGGPGTSAPSVPSVVDRATFQAGLDRLRVREKAHTARQCRRSCYGRGADCLARLSPDAGLCGSG